MTDHILDKKRNYLLSAYQKNIEKRAYLIWLTTGRSDPLANWLQAEKEFLQSRGIYDN